MRSINNVVDATNYVMFELNQPMHAYDAATLRGGKLVVRRARAGERLVTLDDVERELSPEMIAIGDAEGVIGLAGVMGGASTEVGNETRDVLLEGAYWNPSRIRRARRTLGMTSEASYRFERGIDRWGGGDAMRRCIQIVLATAGGELADAPLDLWPEPSHPPRIFLRPARVAQVLGVEIPWAAIEQYLVAIGATVVSKPDDGRIAVDVPGWRPDLVREIDLIEEIARLHGYDSFPSDLRPFRLGKLADAEEEAATTRRPAWHGGPGSLRDLPASHGSQGRRRRRPAGQSALGRGRLAPAAAPAGARAAGRVQLGQSRCGRAPLRDRHYLDRRGARRAPSGGAAGRGRAHRPARAGALERERRGALRSLGPEGPLRGRRRSGNSRWGDTS